VLFAGAGQVAARAAQKPSPQELWEAYPLQPGSKGSEPADPAPTPTPAPTRAAGRAAVAPSARETSGTGAAVILLGGALFAFCVGIASSVLLRRSRRASRTAARAPVNATAGRAAAPRAPAKAKGGRAMAKRAETADAPAAASPSRAATIAEVPRASAGAEELDVPPGKRFARKQPWPDDAADLWTCQLEWKAGYRKSAFRALAGAPGDQRRRRRMGESAPIKWMLMGEPVPPTPEMAAAVRALTAALVESGWEHIGSGRRWYGQRFVWRQEGEPRPVESQTGGTADA
jgi:hypothetical protein